MYAEYFHFARMPFDNTADPRFFFKTAEHEEALAVLVYGVTQRRGITVVTGQPGTGKTLLGRMLIEAVGNQAGVVFLSHVPEDGHEFIATLCRDLGVRHRSNQSTGELIDRLQEYLIAQQQAGATVVVVIDEAQGLSSEVLNYLRLLINLERDAAKLLQIALLGHPGVVDILQRPETDQLRQRIFCSCQLKPLARDQTARYIRHRLSIAGATDAGLFDDEAVDLIHDQSGGLPRVINQIADASLLTAYSGSKPRVDRQTVVECLRDIMSLQLPQAEKLWNPGGPQPRHTPVPPGSGSPVISPAGALPQMAPAQPPAPTTASVQESAELFGRLDFLTRHADQCLNNLHNLLNSISSTESLLQKARVDAQSASNESHLRTDELKTLLAATGSALSRLEAEKPAIRRLLKHTDQRVQDLERQHQALQSLGEHLDRSAVTLAERVSAAEEIRERLSASEIEPAKDLADRLEAGGRKVERLRHDLDLLIADGRAQADQTGEIARLCNDRAAQLKTLLDETQKTVARADEMKLLAGVVRKAELITGVLTAACENAEKRAQSVEALSQQLDDSRKELADLNSTLATTAAESRSLAGQNRDLLEQSTRHASDLRSLMPAADGVVAAIKHVVTEARDQANHTNDLLGQSTRQTAQLQSLIPTSDALVAGLREAIAEARVQAGQSKDLLDQSSRQAADLRSLLPAAEALSASLREARQLTETLQESKGTEQSLNTACDTARSLIGQANEAAHLIDSRASELSVAVSDSERALARTEEIRRLADTVGRAEEVQQTLSSTRDGALAQVDALTALNEQARTSQETLQTWSWTLAQAEEDARDRADQSRSLIEQVGEAAGSLRGFMDECQQLLVRAEEARQLESIVAESDKARERLLAICSASGSQTAAARKVIEEVNSAGAQAEATRASLASVLADAGAREGCTRELSREMDKQAERLKSLISDAAGPIEQLDAARSLEPMIARGEELKQGMLDAVATVRTEINHCVAMSEDIRERVRPLTEQIEQVHTASTKALEARQGAEAAADLCSARTNDLGARITCIEQHLARLESAACQADDLCGQMQLRMAAVTQRFAQERAMGELLLSRLQRAVVELDKRLAPAGATDAGMASDDRRRERAVDTSTHAVRIAGSLGQVLELARSRPGAGLRSSTAGKNRLAETAVSP